LSVLTNFPNAGRARPVCKPNQKGSANTHVHSSATAVFQ